MRKEIQASTMDRKLAFARMLRHSKSDDKPIKEEKPEDIYLKKTNRTRTQKKQARLVAAI